MVEGNGYMTLQKASEEARKSHHGARSQQLCVVGVYVMPYLILASVAFYLPAHSGLFGIDLSDNWLTRTVPSISGYISKSRFPSATATYLILSGALFLPYLILGLIRPISVMYLGSRQRMEAYRRKFCDRPFLVQLFIVISNFGFIWIAWLQPGYQFGVLPFHEQRWALAIGGPLISFFSLSYFFVNGFVISLRFLMDAPFERDGHGME